MKVLVTGGSGFLGRVIVQQLLDRGDLVRVYSRGNYPDLVAKGIEVMRGDISDGNKLSQAAQGMEAIIHTASKVGVWGDYKEYYRSNVLGTEAVIAASKQHNIQYLVYTSSPSAVYNGKPVAGADESLPYPEHFMTAYCSTKAKAEQLILKANSDSLKTVALRPHFIWGPHDNQLIPRIIARARSGKLRLISSNGVLTDTIYVDNAAKAHLLALDNLRSTAVCAGKVYFVSQDEPIEINAFINHIITGAGLPPTEQFVSARTAFALGAALEFFYTIFHLKKEPLMTRFIAKQLSTTCWYDISAAKRDLGYKPEISIEEGLQRVSTWLKRECH